ncbi:hypothetical protein C8Q73DRAFT_665515 [Cubamyces lactineus]|nr:hypothetical protein C8Q73DRAFT_665515 [Cubamyces lactineus]
MPASSSLGSGIQAPRPVVATVPFIAWDGTSPQEPDTQLHDLEQYVSAYRRTISMKDNSVTRASPIPTLTTQRLGTRPMNDQVHGLLREHHMRRWSPRVEASEDAAPKNVSAPSGHGTPANLLAEWERFPMSGPFVPHDYIRGLRIPKWYLTYDISTPAELLLLHRLAAKREMPQPGTAEWRTYKKTSVDVVKDLNKNR